MTPSWPWDAYFKQMGIPQIADLNIAAPGYFAALEKQLTSVPLNDWKAYLRWHTARLASPYLSTAFVDADFAFFSQTLAGAQQLQPRWKRCVGRVDRHLGEALGQVYVEKYFTADTRARTLRMVQQIEAGHGGRHQAAGLDVGRNQDAGASPSCTPSPTRSAIPSGGATTRRSGSPPTISTAMRMNAMAFEVTRQLVEDRQAAGAR